MASLFVARLVQEPAPSSLKNWAWQTMLASFNSEQMAEPYLWGSIATYCDWLAALSVLDSNPTTGG